MSTVKVAISVDDKLIKKLDDFVKLHIFPNRSRAFQEAVKEKIDKIERKRLAKECQKLNPKDEQALADEYLSQDIAEWPEY